MPVNPYRNGTDRTVEREREKEKVIQSFVVRDDPSISDAGIALLGCAKHSTGHSEADVSECPQGIVVDPH
jgi:hypothetical protein